jgi:hypothetical protein
MGTRESLVDPEFEPTDEQLTELSVRAFAGVREQRERALSEMRARIEDLRRKVLSDLAARYPAASKST